MSLNYFGFVFIIFGAVILTFRKYFLNEAINSKGFWSGGYSSATKPLIFLTGVGFIIVGLLVLFGILMK